MYNTSTYADSYYARSSVEAFGCFYSHIHVGLTVGMGGAFNLLDVAGRVAALLHFFWRGATTRLVGWPSGCWKAASSSCGCSTTRVAAGEAAGCSS